MTRRVLFDGLNLALDKGTGVATYTRVLARLVRELGYETGVIYNLRAKPPKNALRREIFFFDDVQGRGPSRLTQLLRKSTDVVLGSIGVEADEIPITGAVLTEPLAGQWINPDRVYGVPQLFDRARAHFQIAKRLLNVAVPENPSLYHWTYPVPIRGKGAPNIYTFHDVIPLRLPYTTLDKKSYYLRSLRKIAATADHIVTVSEQSKYDIIKYVGIDESRITNTHQSVHIPPSLINRTEDVVANELEGMLRIGHRKYLLFYGSLEPKKNLGRTVQAYLSANVDMPLIVVAAQGWKSENEVRLLEQKFIANRRKIIRFDYLPFPLLVTLIQGARAVLFPSLYEGFGLPVLESMTLGTPIITSTTSSVPEVAGEAALLINPFDTDALKKAIQAICSDDDLWEHLRQSGLQQATKFSQDRYRDRIQTLYASLI